MRQKPFSFDKMPFLSSAKVCYNARMNNLLISSVVGIVWLILLFLLCFALVHVLRLARLGQAYRKSENTPQAPPPPPPPQEKPSEPIYYIVEKKKRLKSSLGEPKRINFK